MKSNLVLLMAMLMLYLPKLHSQPTLQINGVENFSFSNAYSFTNSAGEKGLYCCYEIKNKAVDGNTYVVQLLSEQLFKIASWQFVCESKESLLETACNGTDFIYITLDRKNKILHHKIHNILGQTDMDDTYKLDENSKYYLEKSLEISLENPSGIKLLYSYGTNDFVSIIPTKHNDVFTYDINIFRKAAGYQKETFTPETDMKTQRASFVGSTEKLLLFYVFKKKVIASNKFEANLIGVETATGKKMFEITTLQDTIRYMPEKVSFLPGQDDFVVMGNYYKEGGKVKQTNSLGLCLLRLNSNGQILAQTNTSWKGKFSQYLVLEKEENEADTLSDDIGHFQANGFIANSDGDFYLVGEGYKYKTRVRMSGGDAVGAAAQFLVFPTPLLLFRTLHNDMVVTDLVTIHVDTSLQIDDVSVHSKTAHFANGFDTDFIIKNPVQNRFSVAYRDYTKPDSLRTFTENLLMYDNGKITSASKQLTITTNMYQVLPATGNKVILMGYAPKKNLLEFSIHDLNP